MKQCTIEDCDRPLLAKGLCASHYQAQRTAAIRAERRAVRRACTQCGVEFSGRDPRAIFCSYDCKERSRNHKRPNTGACLACQSPLLGKRVDAKYCNNACLQRHKIHNQIAERNAARSCDGCGGSMPALKHGKARYCSAECRIRSRRHETYGLTKAELDLLLAQNESCAICGTAEWGGPHKKPNVDHDHATGKVRGILCASCNNGLGRFRDDPALLQAAITYLTKGTS